ncbi:MAG: S41 family peptidase [Bacteroidales bacterium]|nr:S41 family peptidase [Bacteroidales bacterium]MDD3891483.1 S41 family peptidase [Bacteroidales bacterium]
MKRTATILIASLMILTLGCKKEEPINELANKQLMYEMDKWYLWYDKMPDVNPQNYHSPIDLLDALIYKELDKWSYITTKQELDAYYDQALFLGYGIGMAFDANNQLWITFIFKDSPLRKFGVDRGWRIEAINNTNVSPSNVTSLLTPDNATFKLINHKMEERIVSATKETVKMNTVLMDSVYTIESKKIGYFVLKGFVGPTVEELNSTFAKFAEQNVNEVIIDLRYNGGGSINTASHLANLLAGSIANGEILGTFAHNNKQSHENSSIYIKTEPNSIYLDKVVFITTQNSASASELVINGLAPHMDVVLVGDKTYGKPVGMYSFSYNAFDWAFVPICFRFLNANNEGDYYDGIPVGIEAADGISFSFGDINEPSLAAAIGHITGLPKTLSKTTFEKLYQPQQKGLREEIGAW